MMRCRHVERQDETELCVRNTHCQQKCQDIGKKKEKRHRNDIRICYRTRKKRKENQSLILLKKLISWIPNIKRCTVSLAIFFYEFNTSFYSTRKHYFFIRSYLIDLVKWMICWDLKTVQLIDLAKYVIWRAPNIFFCFPRKKNNEAWCIVQLLQLWVQHFVPVQSPLLISETKKPHEVFMTRCFFIVSYSFFFLSFPVAKWFSVPIPTMAKRSAGIVVIA